MDVPGSSSIEMLDSKSPAVPDGLPILETEAERMRGFGRSGAGRLDRLILRESPLGALDAVDPEALSVSDTESASTSSNTIVFLARGRSQS
jgi:hypothetical protein